MIFGTLTLVAQGLGCRAPRELAPPPMPTRVMATPDPRYEGEPSDLPPRWIIDGASVAVEPPPLALTLALEAGGYAADDVQDYISSDLNSDGIPDAVALLVAPGEAGGFEALAVLSEGEGHQVASLAAFAGHDASAPWSIYSLTLVPLTEGPSLIGLAPRPGACTRGPQWSFVRVTGVMLESAGRVALEPYDCAVADASLEFERDAGGVVSALELRHGDALQRYIWDRAGGTFMLAPALAQP